MDILKNATVDHLAAAVIKVAQLSAQGDDLDRLYSPWEDLKKDEDTGSVLEMEERYRMTKMPLPKEMGTVIPQIFNYTDYTEIEIIKVHQRKGYMPMDDLQGYKQYTTRQLQGAIKDVFSNNKSGMMLSAAAGWGKSTIYEYFGAMAAQHSLTHKELWMKPGTPKNLAGMRDHGNIQEQHFLKFNASNLSQTQGEKGRSETTYRELEKIIKDPKYSGIYTFVIDELYTALSSDSSDASEAWGLLKGYLAPGERDPYIKVIGTFASEDLKKFETGRNPRTGQEFYPAQMQRRMPLIQMRDYNREEGFKVLENGYDQFASLAGLGKQLPEPDHMQLFNAILDKADLATDSSGHVVFGLPERIKKVMQTAANTVRTRATKFEQYRIKQELVERDEQILNWGQAAIPKLNQEKQEIAQGRNMSEEQVAQDIHRIGEEAGMGGIISIRDIGSKLPHEEIETPESIEESKREKMGEVDQAIENVKKQLQKKKGLFRLNKIFVEQGIAKIKQQFGDIFRPDFKDVGNVKLQDVEKIPQQNLIMAG